MMQLENLKPGISLVGIEPTLIATVLAVVPIGDGAVQVLYKIPEGTIKDRLLGRADEASISLATIERPWAFDGNGDDFKLAVDDFKTTPGFDGAMPPATGPQGSSTSNPPTAGASAASAPGTAKAKSFYGSVEVNPTTAKMRLVQLADEIINNLVSDPHAELQITVEINANFPAGASDQIKRAVSENAKSLGFKTSTWE